MNCYGEVSLTGPALELLFRHEVPTAWFSPAGARCRGRLVRTDAPTTLTRIRQHRVFAQPEARLDWAKLVVAGKIEASIGAARHFQRHGVESAREILLRLGEYLARLPAIQAHESLLGLEGTASAAWFDLFGRLFVAPWSFPGRVRRPPTDPLNALLSLGYTWLLARATARAEARGYEIYIGGLHEYRAGRPSLSCDLIEPLRVPAVDRWAIAACGKQEFLPTMFTREENGGFRLPPKWFGRTLHSWETFWVQGGLEAELERWLDRLGDFLRSRETPNADTGAESHDL